MGQTAGDSGDFSMLLGDCKPAEGKDICQTKLLPGRGSTAQTAMLFRGRDTEGSRMELRMGNYELERDIVVAQVVGLRGGWGRREVGMLSVGRLDEHRARPTHRPASSKVGSGKS